MLNVKPGAEGFLPAPAPPPPRPSPRPSGRSALRRPGEEHLLGDLPVPDGVDGDFGVLGPLPGLLLRGVEGVFHGELVPIHEGALRLTLVRLEVVVPPLVLLPDGSDAGHFGRHALEVIGLDADYVG